MSLHLFWFVSRCFPVFIFSFHLFFLFLPTNRALHPRTTSVSLSQQIPPSSGSSRMNHRRLRSPLRAPVCPRSRWATSSPSAPASRPAAWSSAPATRRPQPQTPHPSRSPTSHPRPWRPSSATPRPHPHSPSPCASAAAPVRPLPPMPPRAPRARAGPSRSAARAPRSARPPSTRSSCPSAPRAARHPPPLLHPPSPPARPPPPPVLPPAGFQRPRFRCFHRLLLLQVWLVTTMEEAVVGAVEVEQMEDKEQQGTFHVG